LSLPAKAVNQIYADNRQTPAAGDKKGASPQVTDVLGLSDRAESNALARKNSTTGTIFGKDHRVASTDIELRSRRHLAVAPAPRPIQVFFVLDDQSVAQSESEAASKTPAAPVAPLAAKSKPSKRPHRKPVVAGHPEKHSSAPPQKAE
ncbi:MAG TPA: hypothetical protein VHX68_06560, partial [Planctomycetaceae bacterium]|nr:hypothetical protein [Planctomycetaceae bacterium]